jgi:hypothetical protein
VLHNSLRAWHCHAPTENICGSVGYRLVKMGWEELYSPFFHHHSTLDLGCCYSKHEVSSSKDERSLATQHLYLIALVLH